MAPKGRWEKVLKERVGFIGLGSMGLPMMRNLLRRGYLISAYDIIESRLKEAAAAGATQADSCRAAAQDADIVISILPTASDVNAALLGPNSVFDGIRPGGIVVEMSTIEANQVRDIANVFTKKSVDVLGAPVVRGVKGAVSGTLAIYVGGAPPAFERCKPILSCLGSDIIYCGDVGAGNAVKLVNNMIVGITMCVLSEAMVLGVKSGVDTDVLFEALSKGSADSFVLQNHVKNHVLSGDFSEGLFSIDYEMKDLSLALSMADKLLVPQRFGAIAYQAYQEARAIGLSKNYYPAVIELVERLAGVKVRSKQKGRLATNTNERKLT